MLVFYEDHPSACVTQMFDGGGGCAICKQTFGREQTIHGFMSDWWFVVFILRWIGLDEREGDNSDQVVVRGTV